MDQRKKHSEIRRSTENQWTKHLTQKVGKRFKKGKPSEGTCMEMIKR